MQKTGEIDLFVLFSPLLFLLFYCSDLFSSFYYYLYIFKTIFYRTYYWQKFHFLIWFLQFYIFFSLHFSPCSSLLSLILPALLCSSLRLGDEGDGFRVAMAGLDGGRLSIGKYIRLSTCTYNFFFYPHFFSLCLFCFFHVVWFFF